MAHYYAGSGRTVTLDDIGHLREIVEQYAYADGAEGAFRRLSNQIAEAARVAASGHFTYPFSGSYDFGPVEFSHGGGSVKGQFDGSVASVGEMLHISGDSSFSFSDSFEDPVGLGIELGGTPYAITGNWSAGFEAEVFRDRARSVFVEKDPK